MFEPVNDAALCMLREQHAELFEIRTSVGQFVVRLPTRAEYRLFRRRVQESQDQGAEASEALVKLCVLYPAEPALKGLIESRAALVDTLSGKILSLAGLDGAAEGKAL